MKVEIEVSDNIVPKGYEIEGIRVLCSRQHRGTPVLLGAGVQYFRPDIDRHGVYIVLREKKVRKYVTLREIRFDTQFWFPNHASKFTLYGIDLSKYGAIVKEVSTQKKFMYPFSIVVEIEE